MTYIWNNSALSSEEIIPPMDRSGVEESSVLCPKMTPLCSIREALLAEPESVQPDQFTAGEGRTFSSISEFSKYSPVVDVPAGVNIAEFVALGELATKRRGSCTEEVDDLNERP